MIECNQFGEMESSKLTPQDQLQLITISRENNCCVMMESKFLNSNMITLSTGSLVCLSNNENDFYCVLTAAHA